MIGKKVIFCWAALMVAGPAFGQVELNTYTDSNGYLDVQKLTCAQLAGTFQEDADYLAAWYSGWYNGLAKKHMLKLTAPRRSNTKSLFIAKPIRVRRSSRPSTWFSRITGPKKALRQRNDAAKRHLIRG